MSYLAWCLAPAVMLSFVASIELNESDSFSASEKLVWFIPLWILPYLGVFLFRFVLRKKSGPVAFEGTGDFNAYDEREIDLQAHSINLDAHVGSDSFFDANH